MLRSFEGRIAGIILGTILIIPVLNAQPTKDTPRAPVPAQISKAKTVFISYAGQEKNPKAQAFGEYSGDSDRTYNEFYAAMKNWGRYELVNAPADCDLVFEISFADPMGGGGVFKGDTIGPVDEPQFRLVIADPKTHVTLWAFTEHVHGANRQGNRDKNFDQAMAKIVDDVKELDARSKSGTENGQK